MTVSDNIAISGQLQPHVIGFTRNGETPRTVQEGAAKRAKLRRGNPLERERLRVLRVYAILPRFFLPAKTKTADQAARRSY